MTTKSNLIRQIKDRKNKFFSSIRNYREIGLRESKSAYSWDQYSYKIYPSSIRSLSMCPKKFIEEDVHKPPSFNTDQVYKMEVGTALHRMYQDEALKHSSELLWDKPNLSNETLIKKLEANWPEVPVYDPLSGISGRADLVLNIADEIVIFDIKTTTVDKDKWEEYKEKRLPSPSHIAQVSIYIYLMNKYKYYTKKITKGAMGYVNIGMAPGEVGSEYEYYFEYDLRYEEMIEDLIRCLTLHRNAWIANETKVPCTYKYCYPCNKVKEIECNLR